MVTGPGSPSVLSNMMVSIEQHVDWIVDCLRFMAEKGYERIAARADFEESWVRHVAETAGGTEFMRGASWYLGANVPGKPRVFLPYVGGVDNYRAHCAQIAAKGYEGFTFSGPQRRGEAG